jgi:hypothetical protein
MDESFLWPSKIVVGMTPREYAETLPKSITIESRLEIARDYFRLMRRDLKPDLELHYWGA